MLLFGKIRYHEIWLLPNLFTFFWEFVYRCNYYYTESSKGLYLAILPLGIMWPPMKYHIKPLGMTKTQGFRQYLYRYDLFLFP